MFKLSQVKFKNIIDIKDLTIPLNKVTCIVGASGSGKTTLIKLLNKIISYDSGEIFYKNQSLNQLNSIELRRKVVMLPQTPAIFTGNIKENLLIGLKFTEKPPVEDDQLNAILKLVQLNKQLTEDADKLSGGEKQRLALARMILLDPEVYLLDEPSSALDEATEKLIIEALVNSTKENSKTLIMVTHSKIVAKDYADNIIELKNGIVINQQEVIR